MKIDEAYDYWARFYDSNKNKTRDLEKEVGQELLAPFSFSSVLELGCGTGKNTTWLLEKCEKLVGVDFSPEMLQAAREKIKSAKVEFYQADLTKPWQFLNEKFDLVTCSLVLEHIENLSDIFSQVQSALQPMGKFYICELHPFKQYTGTKARFKKENSTFELETFNHHISDFMAAAHSNNLKFYGMHEWFDSEDKAELPRLISFIFEKE
ncbi:MAG: class I SAM-dependent methyltransferase [Calditrichaeota bacterium]|nr:MAG: class I SAM-dependent methyltransferase [Calditrichota bacterium]